MPRSETPPGPRIAVEALAAAAVAGNAARELGQAETNELNTLLTGLLAS